MRQSVAEGNKNWVAVVSEIGGRLFSVIGGVGYFLLILYPNRIDYIQEVYFNKISFFTLVSLIIGTLCAILSICFPHRRPSHRAKRIFWLSVPLIFLMASFSTPCLLVKSVTSAQNICVNNARQIEAAKTDWAIKNAATNGTDVTWNDITPYFTNGFPKCPETGIYTLGKIGQPVVCSVPNHQIRH